MQSTWVRPRPSRTGITRDLLAAIGLAAGFAASAGLYTRIGFYDDPAPLWLTALAGAAATLPLALRRRAPITVLAVVSAAFFVIGQFHVPELLFCNITLFIALYTVGAWGADRRHANIARAVVVVFMAGWVFVNIALTVNDAGAMPYLSRSGLFSALAAWAVIQVITNLFYFAGSWYFGNAMWARAEQTAELQRRGRELAAEHAFSTEQAVALDRVRIARELHDVVAHHVSVMGVQAGAARRVLGTDPTRASASLEIIEQSARDAVDELHRLLATLRESDGDEASASSSTRGVAQLSELVRTSEQSGVPTTLQTIGEPRLVSPLVGLILYRIAQEALTNVRKHAGSGASAEVRLRYTPAAVELEIADTGTRSLRHGSGNGLGQRGMVERAAAAGGTVEFTRRGTGGYLVRASIPVVQS